MTHAVQRVDNFVCLSNTGSVLNKAQSYLPNETISFVDSVIRDNPSCSFILLGDMNCNIHSGNNPFTTTLNTFLLDRGLVCTYN